MGRMSHTNNYESRLWQLLEAEHLADLSQFHQRGFFDEVPLFSRNSDIDFLPKGNRAASEILLRFAFKFLKSVIAYEEHRTGYLAAITVWDLSMPLLVPNLFVWCGPVRALKDKLALTGVMTPFGKRTKKLVQAQCINEPFAVLEDNSTVPDMTRIFIAPARSPYPGFMALDAIQQPARAPKGRSASRMRGLRL